MNSIISEVSRGIHAGGRLVEHQQFRPRRKRPSDLQAPLLAVSEIARQDVAAAAKPDEAQQLQRLVVGLPFVGPGVAAN